jgi:hypothetical protein
MSFIVTIKTQGEERPIGRFETLADATRFEEFASTESSFTFNIEEVMDFRKNLDRDDIEGIMATLHDHYLCWNRPTTTEPFEGFKQGE